jgi:hypothetical protein
VQVFSDKQLAMYHRQSPKVAFCKPIRQSIRELSSVYEGKPYTDQKCKANREFTLKTAVEKAGRGYAALIFLGHAMANSASGISPAG